ncbi:MAG: hypothetical protein VKL39_23780, partial [Leptolyngbyaceae bacterium]|nr:hypothetical protein [Leptolyngbyaceae bacterium]
IPASARFRASIIWLIRKSRLPHVELLRLRKFYFRPPLTSGGIISTADELRRGRLRVVVNSARLWLA